MSASSFATSNGGDTRDARDDERQNPIIPVQPINGVCRVYIAPPPTADDNELFCRICHDTKSDNVTPLISPCRCTGSSALVHQACIENWLTLSGRESCDLCNYRLPVYKTLKPIREVSCTLISLASHTPRDHWRTRTTSCLGEGEYCVVECIVFVYAILCIQLILHVHLRHESVQTQID